MDDHGRLERLSPLDVSNLRVENHGLPMHVAALVILDQASAAGPPGLPGLDTLRATVGRRLHRAPRLRQVLLRPGAGLGPPVWADDPHFDIRQHVRARAVPAPGDEAALLRECAELNAGRLDRSRPLWELWLLTGLAGGRAGLLIRLHHVAADGVAAVAMMGALFDPGPPGPEPDAPAWRPRPAPGRRELLADAMRGRALAGAGVLRGLRRPAALIVRLRGLARNLGDLAREGRAPRVSINVPVSGRRRLVLVRADLALARSVAHAHGGTVNDVVLAAVAGGARSLLAARGELTPGLALKASVAASLRGPSQRRVAGNRVGMMIVPLPLGEAEPGRLLARVASATAPRKRRPLYQPNGRLAQRWMVRVMARQRLVNLFVSNLPGPPVPLSVAGARVAEIFQIAVVQGNVPVSVGAFSYAGQLNLGITGDRGAVPDLGTFADGVTGTLAQLGVLAADGLARTGPR